MDELQQLADEARAAWRDAEAALEAAKASYYESYPDDGIEQRTAAATPQSWAAFVVKRDAVTDAHDAEIVARGAYSVAVHALQLAVRQPA